MQAFECIIVTFTDTRYIVSAGIEILVANVNTVSLVCLQSGNYHFKAILPTLKTHDPI